jgi:hypothetical protein
MPTILIRIRKNENISLNLHNTTDFFGIAQLALAVLPNYFMAYHLIENEKFGGRKRLLFYSFLS